MTSPQDPQYPPPAPPYGGPPAQPYGGPPAQPYGAPPAQPYGAPPSAGLPPQAFGAPLPPPIPVTPTVSVKPTAVAYLVPLAAVLAIIGVFTPWFRPHGTASANGQTVSHNFDSFYSWRDGKIGLIAPILLVILAIGVLGLLRGKASRRFSRGSTHPIESAGRAAVIAGLVSLAAVGVAYALVTSQYKFTEDGQTYSWGDYIDFARSQGVTLTLTRGPQLGLWLTAAAGLVAVVAGILLIVEGRKQSRAPVG